MKRITVAFIAILFCAFTAFSQPRGMMRDAPDEMPPFLFFEAVNLIATDSSLSRLDIQYRIDQNFFIAVKNRDSNSPLSFISRGEVLIDLFDSLGVSKARSIQRIEIGADNSERGPAGSKWSQGISSFQVPPGPYKIVFEIDDLESERRFTDDKYMVRLKKFGTTLRETSTPLFIDWKSGQAPLTTVTPIGFGPHLLFGRKAAVYIEVPLGTSTASEAWVEYRILSKPLQGKSTAPIVAETLSVATMPHVRLERVKSDSTVAYMVSSNDSSKALGLFIPLASEKLPLRRFDLAITIKVGGEEYKATKNFQMVWPEMPFSLRDVDYAINALKYITTDDQRDSLRSGDFEQRRDNLEAFWKRKDNTRGTAYNEVMVEYYKRVDHATKTFGTLREPDGFKSDRGKTYILYGPPTKTERALSSSEGYKEMWIYETLGKRFIFADQTKTGNYVLVSTQSL